MSIFFIRKKHKGIIMQFYLSQWVAISSKESFQLPTLRSSMGASVLKHLLCFNLRSHSYDESVVAVAATDIVQSLCILNVNWSWAYF